MKKLNLFSFGLFFLFFQEGYASSYFMSTREEMFKQLEEVSNQSILVERFHPRLVGKLLGEKIEPIVIINHMFTAIGDVVREDVPFCLQDDVLSVLCGQVKPYFKALIFDQNVLAEVMSMLDRTMPVFQLDPVPTSVQRAMNLRSHELCDLEEVALSD